MNAEKWENIKGHIKDNFKVEDEGSEHFDDEGGVDIEYLEFAGPLGRMRIEFVSKPVVTGKKTNYSRRIGSETAVEYLYSDNEKNTQMHVYKWNDESGEWMEIEAANIGSL